MAIEITGVQRSVHQPTITFVGDTPRRRRMKRKSQLAPRLYDIASCPQPLADGKPSVLGIGFQDSSSGARLVRLQVDSIGHSLDFTRELSRAERKAGWIEFDLPGMATGVVNVQVSLYDNAGRKDYLARTLYVLHNPVIPIFTPTGMSMRLVNGSARMGEDGRFHCDSNIVFFNGTAERVTLDRRMRWAIVTHPGGEELESGVFDWGSNISLPPIAATGGGWMGMSIPRGTRAYDRLRAREAIVTEWQFQHLETHEGFDAWLTWRAMMGPNINLIRVGDDVWDDVGRAFAVDSLQYAARSIFLAADMDFGEIRGYTISAAEAGGFLTIDSTAEAEDLTEAWTVLRDGIDVFVVPVLAGTPGGWSPIPGPCDKDAKGGTGAVVELQIPARGRRIFTSEALSARRRLQGFQGVIFAHELGHYLGLGHSSASRNVMSLTASRMNTLLTPEQAATMRAHCFCRFLR